MPQNRSTSPTSVPERLPSQSTADHLPPKPSCGLRVIQKPSLRADGNVVCKKRKRSMERREQKVSNDRDKMCLAQRLRHHDAQGTDRHARYDLWRGTPRRKEQRRSDSPSCNHKDSDRHSPHNPKPYDLHISDDKGNEKTSALPAMNNRASGGPGDIIHEAQRPTSQSLTAELANKFLDSIDLSNTIPSNALLVKGTSITPTVQSLPQTSVSIAPVPLPLPGSPAVDVRPVPTLASEPLSLLHHGHRLDYDLNLLPNDPIGPITLLGATQSEPGAYLIVGAHYRRTGRSRAACEVINAMLQKHAPATYVGSVIEGNKENDFLHQASTFAELPTGFKLSHIDVNAPAHEASVLRPAFLLLAACRLDISRDCSSPKEKISHANAAQELFRALYGPKSNTPPYESRQAKANPNALGLASMNRTRILSAVDNNVSTSVSTQTPGIPTAPAATRILALEEELRITHTANITLEATLADAKKLQERTDQSAKEAESRSRQALRLLEIERDEYRAVQRRLMETEQKLSDMEQSATGSETRVWARLRDLVCDQFASARGL